MAAASSTPGSRRFEREARVAARLHHTNIVLVFGVGESDGIRYCVMQFIRGLGLDQVLDEVRRLQAGPASSESPAGDRDRTDGVRAPRWPGP